MWLDKLLLSLCLLDWIDFKNLILAISWNGFPTMSKLLFATCPQRDSKCRQLLLEIQQPFKKSLNEFWSNFHWCSDDELSFIGSLKKVRILFTKNIKSPYTKKIYMIVFFCVCGFFSFLFFFFCLSWQMIQIIFVGMDEMEFTEAESNMNDLIAEYQTYQVRKKIFSFHRDLFP